MKKYRTLATVRLSSGNVMLNDVQATKRAVCLKKIKRGVFEIEKPVEFKAGEIIGFDDVPKPYRPLLEEVTPTAGAKPEGIKLDDV